MNWKEPCPYYTTKLYFVLAENVLNKMMFSYTGAEYVAVVYVDEERDFICGDCLKKGPEAIKKAAQERAQEIRDEIRLELKEAELLEKIASGDIVYPWDDQEKFSKCAK